MKNIFNCPVTREMLKNPSATDAKAVRDYFIEEVYGKRPEDMAQPDFESLEVVDHPELYEHSIPSLHYIRECQKLCQAASFSEFGIRDIHAPDKSRFHWELSALINFSKFRATRLESFENMAKHADDLLERERMILSEKSSLQHEISAIEQKRAAEEPEVEKFREVVSKLSVEIHELHKQQRALMDETREMKEELAQKTKKGSSLGAQKVKLVEETEQMAARVVSSPDRVRGEIENMRCTLEEKKQHNAEVEKEKRVLTDLADHIKEAMILSKEALQVANECTANRKRAQELEQKRHECEVMNTQFEQEVVTIEDKRKQVERWLESTESKILRVDEQQNEIDKENAEADQALVEKRKELSAEKQSTEQYLEEKKNEKEEMIGKFIETITNMKDMLEHWISLHNAANESFSKLHNNVHKALTVQIQDDSNYTPNFLDS